jgi:hypothetical protein
VKRRLLLISGVLVAHASAYSGELQFDESPKAAR